MITQILDAPQQLYYNAPAMPPRTERSQQIFGPFSENARQVLIRTWNAAQARNHRDISSGLIFYGAIGDNTVAQLFMELGVDNVRLSRTAEAVLMRTGGRRRTGEFRLLPDAKEAILLTLEEFNNDGSKETTPLQIARGLTRIQEGSVVDIFDLLEVNSEDVYQKAKNFRAPRKKRS